MDTNKKITFGLMCNSLNFQQWQANCIKMLLTDDRFELQLIVANFTQTYSVSLTEKLNGPLLYRQFENRLVRPKSRKLENLQDLFKETEILYTRPQKKGNYAEYIPQVDVEKIKSHQLDFIVRFGFGILKGDILNAANWGIWSYHHGDPEDYRGGPPGFWEMVHDKNTTGAILQRLTEKLDLGIILYKGSFPTIKHSYSEQIDTLLFGSESWIKSAALACHYQSIDPENGICKIERSGKLYKRPTNSEFIHCAQRLLLNRFRFYKQKYFFREKWTFGLTKLTPNQLLTIKHFTEVNWAPLSKLPSVYHADSFVLKDKDQLKIYFEKYDYKNKKAVISRTNYRNGNFSTNDYVVLTKPYHLSYPSIFEWNNEHYLIPESWKNKGVSLYKIKNDQVVPVAEILTDFKAIDPTLVHHQNKFWLFCTEKSGSNYSLHLFHSESIEGPYLPHELNPVKTNVTGSRPAGGFFTVGDKLYRPTQNCSETYGGSVIIQEITTLSTQDFKEEPVNEIFPDPSWKFSEGLHTISIADGVVVFDAKRHEFHFDPRGN